MTKEALKLALDALDAMANEGWLLCGPEGLDNAQTKCVEAITAIKEALAQQEPDKNGSPCPEFWDWLPKAYNFEGNGAFTKYNMEVAFLAGKQSQPEQEPVAWTVAGQVRDWSKDFSSYQTQHYVRPVFTSPPQRKPLTMEQLTDLFHADGADPFEFARAIEAAHGIKENT